ncbi:uncharacterized protein NPIL_592441 [Nephila pilipes]|uniref:Rho termination factor N-terminal domain-containing protein n=1 Tax=Nephila pilipes TaxID=299642 RepID=A0A8X6UG22_NEPPI|nr:uncharacterized protein NPIL_592441 [Nephila pilipes]
MSGIAKLKKDELRIVAEEIGLVVNEGMKKSELRRLIEDSDVFKNDNEAVKSAVEDILENRNKKSDQDSEIEIERLKIERIKLELQLAQVKANGNNTSFDQGCKSEPEESLDSLIKSVRTLTIKPPSVEATLANLRTQFWITNGRYTVKRVLHKCLKCLKLKIFQICQGGRYVVPLTAFVKRCCCRLVMKKKEQTRLSAQSMWLK